MVLMAKLEVLLSVKQKGPRGKDGKNGGKTVIRVPCGTSVYEIKKDLETEHENKNFIFDLE